MQAKRVFNQYVWAFLLILAGIGVALDLIVIRHGVGASGDAVWYMQGAENILKGYGYGIMRGDGFLPTTMFPPFYSVILAGLGWFGISIYELAGLLNAILLGANIYLTGWIIYRLTRSPSASILASVFTLLCFDLFVLHTWAMSEPLYLTLTLLSLLLILHYQENGKRPALALAGLAAGLSVITRLVGISLVATLCLWILVFGKGSMKKRFLEAVIPGIIGLLPVAIFFIRNAALTEPIAGRSALVLHAIPIENYISIAQTLTSWFFPGILNLVPLFFKVVLFVGLMLLSALLFFFSVRHLFFTEDDSQRLYTQYEYLLLIFLAFYGFTFIGSIYLSLAGSPTNWTSTQTTRYLTPIFPVFLILIILAYLRVQRAVSARGKVYGSVAIGLVLAFLAFYFNNFSSLYRKGIYLGYTEIRNDFPTLVDEMKSIDSARPLIASNYELVTFLAGRPVYSMPGEGDELTGIANPDLPQLLANITDLIDKGAILVVYRVPPDETFYYDSLINDLTMINTFGNGGISISLYTKTGEGQ